MENKKLEPNAVPQPTGPVVMHVDTVVRKTSVSQIREAIKTSEPKKSTVLNVMRFILL